MLASVGVGGGATTDTSIAPYMEDRPTWSSYDTESGFNYTRSQYSGYLGGGEVYQGGEPQADDGDYFTQYVWLAAGTYTFTFMYSKYVKNSIIEVFLDATSLGTFDSYSAGAVYNAVGSATSITVAADGVYSVKFKASGKNASSADYYVEAIWWGMLRTGA